MTKKQTKALKEKLLKQQVERINKRQIFIPNAIIGIDLAKEDSDKTVVVEFSNGICSASLIAYNAPCGSFIKEPSAPGFNSF